MVVPIIATVLVIASFSHAYAASNGQSSGQGGDGGSGGSSTPANAGSLPAANGAGGNGGDGGVQTQTGGAGGASVSGGSTAPNGSAGLSSTYGGGGGGGGGALLSSLSSQSRFVAGNGGDGGDGINAAGSGGAGGSVYTTDPVASVSLHITGGNGGAGGYGLTSTKFGHGGRGGDALVIQAAQSKITIESTAVLLGGNGGEGGDGNNSSLSGSGGDGGNGVSLAQNVDLYIQSGAQVTGGSAGSAGQQGQYIGAAGQAGVGIYMAGNDQLTTAGTISGGTQSGSNPVVAVQLDGGGNTLTLLQGYVFNGSVSSSGNDTLVLGGDVDGIFTGTINLASSSNCTQSFCGFTNYEKNGASIWQLATPTTQAVNWTIVDGTLQATSDTLGSGAITDNANLALVQSTDGTVSNLITGTGSLSKGGSGTLTLSAANSYSGGTVITAGTLEGTVSSFGSGAITDNSVLALVQPTNATLSNLITGTGSLSKGGSGTLTLAAANSYSGGTLITAGILKGAASSFGSGSITNNATLNVTSSSSADTLNNTVTGTGELLVSGSGTLTLGGVNSYSGKTSLLSGGLRLMQSSALGDSLLDMAAGTTLTLGRTGLTVENAISLNTGTGVDVQSGTDVLSGVLSDGTQQGTLVKTGSGTLILSGVNSYTGATDIAGGTLQVDGSIATSSTITADNGTTLSGSGIVGNTIMESGSTLLPVSDAGNATLTVNGNLTLQSGSTYMVDSTQLGGSDRVDVTGTATLGSGANITFNPGLWEVGTSYDLLHADQQVNGVFGSITTTLAFLTPTLTYTADDVRVSFQRNQASFASIGQSRNEQAVGSGLDSLQSGAMWDNIVDSDARTARRAFNLLSGEVHASVRTSLVQDSLYVRDAVIDRLLAADCKSGGTMGQKTRALNERGSEGGCAPHAAVWIQNYGSFAHTASNGNASSLSDNAGGFVLGLDVPVAGWHVGVMSGYGHSDLSAPSVGSTGKSDNVHIGAYAGTQWGRFGLRLGAAYTFDMLSSNRKVVFNEYNATLKAHYGGGTAQAFGELGYRMELGRISAEPFANVAFVSTHSARYSEQGADAALAVDAQSQGTTLSSFGAHLGSHFKLMGVLFKPLATLAYRHAFGGITPTVNEQFAGGRAFEVAGAPLASDSAVVNAGLSANVTDRLDLNLSYLAQYATMTTINGVTGSARLQF
ncbi:MAG: autotransporter domain-containing protein [Acetobacter sp.]